VNDITITNSRSDPDAEPPTFERPPLDAMFESYTRSLNTLYDAGARNFLVLTCPPFERSIIDVSTPAWSQRHLNFITDISSFNARIFDMVFAFRANHTDAHTSIFDAHRLFAAVLERPHQFEPTIAVTNTTGVCHEADEEDQPGPIDIVYERNICRGGELIQSFAWTSLHATYPMHNATAAQIVRDCFGGDGSGEYCHA
jgi:phospholipase/lecithinase/hemolysin